MEKRNERSGMMTRDDIDDLMRDNGIVVVGEAVYALCQIVAAKEREACIDIIETYRIPVGNSRSGELACEWTYRALHEIRDDIRARGKQ